MCSMAKPAEHLDQTVHCKPNQSVVHSCTYINITGLYTSAGLHQFHVVG